MAVAVATGIIVAVAIALGYAKYAGAWVVAMAFIATACVRPVLALAVCFCAIALVPFGQPMFGFRVPNLDNAMGPLLLAGVVGQCCCRRLDRKFSVSALDGLVIALVAAGAVGMLVTPGIVLWKYYMKNVVCPVCFYFVGRFIELDRGGFQILFKALLLSAIICAILVVWRELPGRSLFYGPRGLYGEPGAWGPMPNFTAAAFLCLLPPLCVAAAGRAGSRGRRVLWGLSAVVVMVALLKTRERAMIAGALLGMAIALLPRKSRVSALAVLLVALAIGMTSFALTGASSTFDRFQTDKVNTRIAYNAGAMAVLRSREWNPIFGIGFLRFAYGGYARAYTPRELMEMAHGTSVERLDARGGFRPYLHNLALALPVESGLLGTTLFLAVALGLTGRWARCLRRSSDRSSPDRPLLFGLAGLYAGVLFSGLFHNLWVMFQPLAYMWLWAGLVAGHPELFRDGTAASPEVPASERSHRR